MKERMGLVLRVGVCVAVAGIISGCASIMSESHQQVVINSQPSKADVYVDGAMVGTTPCSVRLIRAKQHPQIEIKKEGYETTPLFFTSKYNPWVFGNFFLGYCSTTGFLVDMNSNKAVMYWPDTFLVSLPPHEGATLEQLSGAEQQRQKSKIVRFVATNYDDLVLQISRGSGDHLNALFDLLQVPEADRAEAIAKIKPLYIKYDDPVELGRAIEMEFPR